MAETTTAKELSQGGPRREDLEAASRERVHEIIEMVSDPGPGAPQRVAEWRS